jgi:hypothetical protein
MPFDIACGGRIAAIGLSSGGLSHALFQQRYFGSKKADLGTWIAEKH